MIGRLGVALLAVAVIGCKDKGSDTSNKAPDLDTDADDTGEEGCGGTPPVAVINSCSYPGLTENEQYDEPVPVLQLDISITDEDKDLHRLRVDIYADEVADGVVDPETSEYVEGNPSTVSGVDECEAGNVTSTMNLFIPAGFVSYGALYDWGAVAVDAAGLSSEIGAITCYSPNEDGTKPTGDSGS